MAEGNNDQHLLLLGKLAGNVEQLLDQQKQLTTAVTSMDSRLRGQEVQSAKIGALSGGLISIGMTLVVEGLKNWASRGGHGS